MMKLTQRNSFQAYSILSIPVFFFILLIMIFFVKISEASKTAASTTPILNFYSTDIKKSISDSKQVTARSNKPVETELSLKQKLLLKKRQLSTNLTMNKINKIGSDYIEIKDQESGKFIKIDSVFLSLPGFAVVEKPNRKIIGATPLLNKGRTDNITVSLDEIVDGQGLIIHLYKDNGDRVFNSKRDRRLRDKKGMTIFRRVYVNSIRNLAYTYYSNNLSEGYPALILKEQLPGKKIRFESTSFSPKKKGNFIVVRRNKNSFPHKIVGVSHLLKYGGSHFEMSLKETVSNEILFAMVYSDNGDNIFYEKDDFPARGFDNLPIIVEFKVIK